MYVYICIHTYMHICLYVLVAGRRRLEQQKSVGSHRLRARACARQARYPGASYSISIYIYMYMCVCVCVCVYVCVCVCACVCVYRCFVAVAWVLCPVPCVTGSKPSQNPQSFVPCIAQCTLLQRRLTQKHEL
jgi:hypothetical protein